MADKPAKKKILADLSRGLQKLPGHEKMHGKEKGHMTRGEMAAERFNKKRQARTR